MTRKTHCFVSAVFLEGGKVLVCRELSSDDYPKSGFHFPGGKVHPDADMKAVIKELMRQKYGSDIAVLSALTPVVGFSIDGDRTVLYPFLCEKVTAFLFPHKQFDYRYLPLSDIASIYLDHLDKILAEKIAFYYPLYTATKLSVERTPREKSEIGLYVDSLLYFEGRLPPAEIKDFSILTRSDIAVADLRKAYKWLLARYDLDYNEYLDLLDYRKNHRGN